MASLQDCYPDWGEYGNNRHISKKKKKKTNTNNIESFYPIEGFSNYSNANANNSPDTNQNITYGAPKEYIPSYYQKQGNSFSNPNLNSNLNSNQNSNKPVSNYENDNIELKKEMKFIRNALFKILEQLEENTNSGEEYENTTHDIILFVIFGLFLIFVLEGISKIVANLALKRGGF
jgi:hypothetical protein